MWAAAGGRDITKMSINIIKYFFLKYKRADHPTKRCTTQYNQILNGRHEKVWDSIKKILPMLTREKDTEKPWLGQLYKTPKKPTCT